MGDYQVLFSGEVAQQANSDAVQVNLARELGIDERKAKQLFSGRTVVIQSQLTHEAALELQSRLGDLGAVCRVKDLSPKNANVADFRVGQNSNATAEQTLRDITAAHRECPRCGHMQLEASHCARCGVDLAKATRQKHKEDLIIEKKIRELRTQQSGGVAKAVPIDTNPPLPPPPEARKRSGVKGWFKRA
jgi:ribosomal protein L37E